MEKVSREIFYHYQRINDINQNWKIGETIEFKKQKENFYITSLKKSIKNFSLIKPSGHLESEIKELSEIINSNKEEIEDNLQRTMYIIKDKIDIVNDYFNSLIKYNQEIIFENIRKEINYDLPSRFNCIWVVNKIEELNIWREILKTQRYRVLKLELSGNLHKTSGEFIDIKKNMNIETAKSNARNYWESKNDTFKEYEYLFEGNLKILEEMD